MNSGPLNLLELLAHGKLYHCRYCRIQFWDRRRLAAEVLTEEAGQETEATASTGNEPDV
jgi:hypothetical protein